MDVALSRTSVRGAALFLLVIACLLAPLGVLLRNLHAEVAEKNVPVTAPDVESDKVAAIAAEFRVDESGAATYSIPIFAVPGTAGVAPKLSLNYSSQGSYGPLGKGWSIGGMSSVARCRATREAGDFIVSGAPTDGTPKPINFTADDRFCLDGQRLIPGVGGAACPAVTGMGVQTLRTEIESFQRVCAYTPTASAANGPAFFTVEGKDGSISWYGDRDNAANANQPNGYVETTAPGHATKAIAWAQTRFQDSTGNYIDYVYTENPGNDSVKGEHLLREVKYTGKLVLPGQTGSASVPYAKIVLNYQWRPEARRSLGYASGGTVVGRWRLANVVSCVSTACATPDVAVAAQARYYEFGYLASNPSGSDLELLGSVTECRDGTKSVCARPTAFTWSSGKYEFATQETVSSIPGVPAKFEGFKLGDVDGDGRTDIVKFDDASGGCTTEQLQVVYGTATAAGAPQFSGSGALCTPAELLHNGAPGEGSWHLLDYNGDGRDDLFIKGPTGQGWRVYLSQGRNVNDSNFIPTNVLGANQFIPSMDGRDDQVHLADFNGDGLVDVLYPVGGGMRVRMMERMGGGFGWGAERTVYIDEASFGPIDPSCEPGPGAPVPGQCSRWISGKPTPKTSFMQMIDFNGDASSDLLLRITRQVRQWTGAPGCQIPIQSAGAGTSTQQPETIAHYGPSAEELQANSAVLDPCWEEFRTDELHALTVSDIGATTITLANYTAVATGNPEAITFGDANADGLADVFIRTSANSDWSYRVNTGRFFSGGGTLALSDFREQARFVDVNGDGRVDFLYLVNAGTYKEYFVRYALPAGGFAASGVRLPGGNARLCSSSNCDQNKHVPVFADFDGDGNLDFLSLKIEGSQIGATLSRSGSRQAPRDTITTITNGFDAVTQIKYGPLTNAALHRRDYDSRNSATNWGRGAPVSDLLMPMYAVASASSSSPQDGNPNAMATVHYRYAGAKMQAGGRGFLGFREIVTFDPNQAPNQHVVTSTLYAQNFPYIGMPAQTVKWAFAYAYAVPACLNGGPYTDACFSQSLPGHGFGGLPGGTVFSRSLQIWEADRDIGAGKAEHAAGVQAPLHVRTGGTVEEAYDPANGVLVSKVETAFDYGAYGNVTMTDVRTYEGASTLRYTVTTSNTYTQDNAAKWRLGRLNLSTVTHSRPGVANVVRINAFNYAMGGAATGLLDTERTGITNTSTHAGPADQNLLKVYTLDPYGNRSMARMCANANGLPTATDCNAALTQFRPANALTVHRYSRIVYDNRGRFATETWEPFWNGTGAVERRTSIVHARNVFGDVTHASDVNGVQTKALYGTLGRAYYTWQQTTAGGLETDAASGMRSITRYRWCGTGTGQVSCPAGAKFREETLTSEAPGKWTYLDVLGRPIMQASQTFNAGVANKDVSAVCTAYDAAGKPRRVSNPFFLPGTTGANGPTVAATACTAASVLWTTTSYDVLGRPVAVSKPDEAGTGGFATATTVYSGLTTTVTDPRGKTSSSLNWATGELRRVTDANGTQMHYAYQADGSVVRVDRDAGRGVVRNAFVYDSLGRKLQQTDPDSGVTTFEYNALGELTAQVDAAGNRIETWYDARGRAWRKVAKRADGLTESEALFNFDTAANGAGKPASESMTGTYEGWIGQTGMSLAQSRTYTYDALGRPYGVSTTIDGTAYPAAVRYDARGRVWKQQDASGRWALHQYTALGHLRAVCDTTEAATVTGCPGSTIPTDPNARTAVIFLEADARGNITRERRAQSASMDVTREYWPRSGRVAGICAGNASTCALMDEGYGWDAVGNLTTTQKELRYLEAYTYDDLNRLTLARATTFNGGPDNTTTTFSGSYDTVGNICKVYGTPFTYEGRGGCGTGGLEGGGGTGTTGPHRVRQTTSASNVVSDYYYDIRGNQTVRDQPGTAGDRAIKYSLDNKAYEIALGGAVRTRYWYGTDGQRYKRLHDGKKTLYLGNVEIETAGGVTTVKRNVAGVLQQSIVGATTTSHYLFHDQLGSVVRTTTATGAIVDQLDYRHFGYRRSFTNPAATTESFPGTTSRGFTGHEHVDGSGISVVHMNGRIYDAQLHRFLQADPMIQAPGNLQSWNAYTYVFNNPLAYTDPTGMFSLRRLFAVVIGVVAAVFGQYYITQGMYLAAFGTAVAGGFAAGYVATGSFKGGVYGAFGAAMTFGVAAMNLGYAANIVAQGFSGGIMEAIQGGNFGHGFLSAGLTATAMPNLRGIQNNIARTAAGAIVGGTISKVTGGKFANGAVGGAIQAAMMGWRSSRTSKSTIGDGSGASGERNPVAAAEAMEKANTAAVKAGIYVPYPSAQAAADAWWNVMKELGLEVEVGVLISKVGGKYLLGTTYSDGLRNSVSGLLGQPHAGAHRGAVPVAYAHTHPDIPNLSGGGMAYSLGNYGENGVVAYGHDMHGDMRTGYENRLSAFSYSLNGADHWNYDLYRSMQAANPFEPIPLCAAATSGCR